MFDLLYNFSSFIETRLELEYDYSDTFRIGEDEKLLLVPLRQMSIFQKFFLIF